MRPIFAPDVDLQEPTRLRDLVPAQASLLRGVERGQRALLCGWGGAAHARSVYWVPGEEYRVALAVPPGVVRVGFRCLTVGGPVTVTLPDGRLTRVWPRALSSSSENALEAATWERSSTEPKTDYLTPDRGAALELPPVLAWRWLDVTVTTGTALVFGFEPLFVFAHEARDEAPVEWGGAVALRGAAGNTGLVVNGQARNWTLTEWRSLVAWVRVAEGANLDSVLYRVSDGGSASVVVRVVGLTLSLETRDTSGTLRRSVVVADDLPDDGAWHQVIVTWRQDATTDAAVYLDGVAMALATNTVSSAVDLAGWLDEATCCQHVDADLAVGELAEVWGRVTAEEAAAVFGDRELRDLRVTVAGRRVLDYWCASAVDEDPDTGRPRYHNLGHEPSWLSVVAPASGADVVAFDPL